MSFFDKIEGGIGFYIKIFLYIYVSILFTKDKGSFWTRIILEKNQTHKEWLPFFPDETHSKWVQIW